MQNIFIKKLTKQDITRSLSPCVEAVKYFFDIDVNMVDEYLPIKVCYYGVNNYNYDVTIHKGYQGEKDWRICGDIKQIYAEQDPKEGDLLLWRREREGFSVEVIHQETSAYNVCSRLFRGNDNYVMVNSQFSISQQIDTDSIADNYRQYITAIKSKPFLLLAGISGTGKSRIVRELARACWEADSEEYNAHKPSNFEMVQVKPNWHDSSELIGYVSRVSGEPVYVAGPFLKFVAKAWENPDVPYFLCLDEMNLAPVEQYFAEYLSVVESRKAEDGVVKTDPIIEKVPEQWYYDLVGKLTENGDVQDRFKVEGITIPQNLIVVGTVNMDETTFSFSRKVLDRAMTIEMNEVNLRGGLDQRFEQIGHLTKEHLIGSAVEGVDVYDAYKRECDIVIDYLEALNEQLEGTPFKIAYRTRNEAMLYVVNNLPYNTNEEHPDNIIFTALDEITNMKVLTRIEGDETKVSKAFLERIKQVILDKMYADWTEDEAFEDSVSIKKINEMSKRLESGYTSFWS